MAMEQFHFTDKDGRDHALPKQFKSGDLRAIRKLDPLDQAYTLLELHASPEALAATDEMTAPEIVAVFRDWMQGLSLGESRSSSS